MAIVTIMCPRTGKQVSTGIELDLFAFNALPIARHFATRCWVCGGEHEWSKRWATLVDEGDAALAYALPRSR